MKRYCLAVLVVLHIAFFSAGVVAQVNESDLPLANGDEATIVEVLRGQIETMRQYDQRLLSTVYWALGTVTALVVAFAGFSWYTNFRISERDKNAMRQEFMGVILEEAAKSRELIENDRFNLQTSLHDQMSELSDELERKLDKRMKDFEEQFLGQMDKFHSSFSGKLDGVNSAVSSSNVNLETKIARLEYRIFELEKTEWERRGVKDNVLSTLIFMLANAIDTGDPYQIADCLDDIQSSLKNGARADSHYQSKLTSLLATLEDKYSVPAGNIRRLLSA